MKTLENEMICGSYRGNPNYCDPYVTREEFEMIQRTIKRNPRTSQREFTYIFTGLIKCPVCGRRMSGIQSKRKKKLKKTNEERFYVYLGYRCHPAIMQKDCTFRMTAFESRIERYLLDEIEDIVARKNAEVIKARNDAHRVSKYDITALQQELDCLNYSWQEGRIKSVEEYDKRYDELMEQIEAAQNEEAAIHDEPDYEKIMHILSGDWKEIYNTLMLNTNEPSGARLSMKSTWNGCMMSNV